mmetsp:Transcript_17235/g.38669  ORF Transcript_17235/g.38669 Transcript_17235/m.38669 type:complete len:268 (-) Transcript_17235:220-1023(-)|eukprot:CAMPEP_0181204660 /NCGR_PEP_ID=MMETSP1096-20121128/20056_1 /TAXON_ID=156174 ORGANISM="Chrysochromulina ericina, Strain CCMP281" /NCGR_SAMPLE_ID=MMETSP1096 /ASSEMBLY_ACC=CAM_ASM_000453 /LENGTH=267 /DNA_ID=CAMNT_0023295379 /DNA_START=703 /DNA_END=1506 /DNA_ORIENTATION=-
MALVHLATPAFVARGVIRAQCLPAALLQDGFCQLCRTLLVHRRHRQRTTREGDSVLARVLHRLEYRIKEQCHEAEVVPVVPVVDVVVVAPHQRPRQRRNVRVDVECPEPSKDLHRVHESDRDRHEERRQWECHALRPTVLRREAVPREGVELIGVLVDVVVSVLAQPLAHIPFVEQVVVIEKDDRLKREEVGDAPQHRAHRPTALLNRVARSGPAFDLKEVSEQRDCDIHRKCETGDLNHVVDELLRYRTRRCVRVLALAPPSDHWG